MFHVGHLNMLKRASALGDILIVGVSTDELNYSKKGRSPIHPLGDRMKIVNAIRFVNICFPEESLEKKREYILEYGADILVIGDDWKGKFDNLSDICTVNYLERTPSVSTTEIIEVISAK